MPKVFNKRDYLGFVAMISVMAASCTKENPNPEGTVFVAGYEVENNIQVAKYWRNGVAVHLSDGTKNAIATSITISGDDLYIAGSEDSIATYWKNGAAISLVHTSQNSVANSISVSDRSFDAVGMATGVSVFVAGADGNIAKFWSRGKEYGAGFSQSPSEATCIVANEFAFYVSKADGSFASYDAQTRMATSPLASGYPFFYTIFNFNLNDILNNAGANSIVAVGNDLYVAGWESSGGYSIAKYWKNREPVVLTDGTKNALANSIAVVDGNVLVAGNENGTAKYWRNGTAVNLSDGTQSADAMSITTAGPDIFVAGFDGNVAKYWKNGLAVNLTDGSNPAKAKSIFVVR